VQLWTCYWSQVSVFIFFQVGLYTNVSRSIYIQIYYFFYRCYTPRFFDSKSLFISPRLLHIFDVWSSSIISYDQHFILHLYSKRSLNLNIFVEELTFSSNAINYYLLYSLPILCSSLQ
jgi:hypothetical protein